MEYAPELPFSGTVVNKAWAAGHQDILKRVLSAHSKSVEWFYDDKNRDEADCDPVARCRVSNPTTCRSPMTSSARTRSSIGAARVSRKKMTALIDALTTLGDVQAKGNIERFVMPGITQISD